MKAIADKAVAFIVNFKFRSTTNLYFVFFAFMLLYMYKHN
jgi:hypothetical protein